MPEGFESDLTPQDVADIVAYVASVGQSPKKIDGNNPQTITADYNGILWLTADSAEIYGTDITFEAAHRNVGYWHDESDHVDWKVRLESGNKYDVYLEWAVASESAGNQLAIEGCTMPVHAILESTGGYDQYQLKKIGSLTLSGGECRIVVHSNGPLAKHNLMDLRGLCLVPTDMPFNEFSLELAPRARADVAAEIARLTRELVGGSPQERELIPTLWDLAIAAGKRNSTSEIARLCDVALPKLGQPLLEWQAVVLGGGVVNGISQTNSWPRGRLVEIWSRLPELRDRWETALASAAILVDDRSISSGSRYDALRMLGTGTFEQTGSKLACYFRTDNNELQAGAASALVELGG